MVEEREEMQQYEWYVELVNLVREEFIIETRGLDSHERVEQVRKSDEEIYYYMFPNSARISSNWMKDELYFGMNFMIAAW